MAAVKDRFRNFILCEDVRYEVGNKKSLIGVISGDIIAGEIPAQIQLALYIEFVATPGVEDTLKLTLWQDDTEIGGSVFSVKQDKEAATLVLPRVIISFAKECALRVTVSINDGEPVEALRKKVYRGPIQPR